MESKWTNDLEIDYDCACEAIRHLMAICSAEISQEEKLAAPLSAKIAALEEECSRFYRWRLALPFYNHGLVERVNAECCAAIRAYSARRGQDFDCLEDLRNVLRAEQLPDRLTTAAEH